MNLRINSLPYRPAFPIRAFEEAGAVRIRCGRLLRSIFVVGASLHLAVVNLTGEQAETPVAINAGSAAERHPVERELIRDGRFQHGFILLDPKPGQRVPAGILRGAGTNHSPIWDLAQWSSKFPLNPSQPERLANGRIQYINAAKSITLGLLNSNRFDLSMAVKASVEYGPRARSQGEPWVHLLVQQDFEDPPPLMEISRAQLHLEARLLRSRKVETKDYSPTLHAAQFQMFLTVQNRHLQSAGYGQLMWFGIPIYDDRARFPSAYKAQDFGGTKMFIFTPSGDAYTSESAHDRQWISIHQDLLPLIREGLQAAWSGGFLQDSKSLADYQITSMNLGWEVPGIFDVEMAVRNLSLVVSEL